MKICRLLFTLVGVSALAAPGLLHAETAIRFINDWKWEGQSAPLLMALDENYFSEEGLAVTMEPGKGSLDGIGKVASGEFEMGSADINSLIRYRDENPEVDLQAIYVIYNSPPFAVLGKRSNGVIGPSNIVGRTLGAPSADGAFAQWPAFTHAYGLDTASIAIKDVSFAEREDMLVSNEVDAITGYSFTSMLTLVSKGVPRGDISLMLMSDFGLDLYGNVIIVNPEFAKTNADEVRGFLRAATRGYKDTVANPTKALESVMTRNKDADASIEIQRLIMAIGHHIVTEEVEKNGMGAVDYGRLERSIEQIARTFDFSNRPSSDEVFNSSFLPRDELRQISMAVPEQPETPATSLADLPALTD